MEDAGLRDVAFSCDDRGAKFLCVTVWSMLERCRRGRRIRVSFNGFRRYSWSTS